MDLIDKYKFLFNNLDLGVVISVDRIKHGNDVDKIVTHNGTYFCKTYTKNWYGRPEDNWSQVQHESGAYGVLKAHGLNTPEVILAELSAENSLGRPFLLL